MVRNFICVSAFRTSDIVLKIELCVRVFSEICSCFIQTHKYNVKCVSLTFHLRKHGKGAPGWLSC